MLDSGAVELVDGLGEQGRDLFLVTGRGPAFFCAGGAHTAVGTPRCRLNVLALNPFQRWASSFATIIDTRAGSARRAHRLQQLSDDRLLKCGLDVEGHDRAVLPGHMTGFDTVCAHPVIGMIAGVALTRGVGTTT